MNKISKMIACVGLAVAALGAVAMPANAAEPTTAVTPTASNTKADQQINILVGDFVLKSSEAGPWYAGYYAGTTGTAYGSTAVGSADTIKIGLPVAGQSGPIRIMTGPFAGKCLGLKDPKQPGSNLYPVDCATTQTTIPMVTFDSAGHINHVNGQYYFSDNHFSDKNTTDPKLWRDVIDRSRFTPQTITIPGTVTPVDITGPKDGETVGSTTPTFEGTGDEGATVVVTDKDGNELCTTTVKDGKWSCTSTVELPAGPAEATATQTATDGTTSTDTVEYTIPVSGPVVDPTIAGGASIALIALAGAVLVARNRKNTATI